MTATELTARVLLMGLGFFLGYLFSWLLLGIYVKRSPAFRALLWGMISKHGSPVELAEYYKSPVNSPFCAVCGKAGWQHASTGFKGVAAIEGHDFVDPTEPVRLWP